MRTLIVAEFISLDGVIQGPGGPDEDPTGGFRFGGWVAPYADEATGQDVEDLHSRPFELLLGRRTYDIWATYWPNVGTDSAGSAIADLFNRVPKYVATHRPATLAWQNSHALQGALADAVRASSTPGRVLITRYVRTGEVRTGTFDEVDVPEET